jgi:GGDEF domain-containing protein
MSLQGPILIVADTPAGEMVQAFSNAGAFPVIEACWGDAFKAATSIRPAAIVVREPESEASEAAQALARHVSEAEPFIPMISRLRENAAPPWPNAMPIAEDAPIEQLIARLASALRVRSLHATVLRRARALKAERNIVAEMPAGDPLDDATVLVVGRGRMHPTLSVLVGERTGVMGALSIDAAARCLNAREIDGVVIGDGLPSGWVEAFLTVLADDSRFRDLPVAALSASVDVVLPNFVQARDPHVLLQRAVPLFRLRAFEARLKRLLQSIECKGMLDPQTGLLNSDAFGRELERAIDDASERGVRLSLARFAFDAEIDRRVTLDAARLVSRLVRNVDFACRQEDGSILFVFAEADLKEAHVAARRLASVLKHTMLQSGRDRSQISPSVTLATLKPTDTVLTLLARVAPRPVAAASLGA